MSEEPPRTREHKTLFVAPAGEAKKGTAAARRAETTSDVRRVRPAWIAAACGAAAAGAAFVGSPQAPAVGPGPLTPPHVKAKLTCTSCHQKAEEGTKAFKSNAREACVNCHGPHPSTREGHKKLAAAGDLGCTTCHTIHRAQSGVRLPAEGPAVRYDTWGETTLDDLAFHNERTVLVPTIPLAVCGSCHELDDPRDPVARCKSGVGGALEPSLCFDEHRVALPPDPAALRPGERPKPQPKPSGVCADQHFEDRSFAWEIARAAVHEAPVVPRAAAAKTPLGWLGAGGAAALLGYAATAGASLVRSRLKRKQASKDAPKTAETKRLPMIDTSTCLGCYACVDACPYGVIEVERYVAVVARPDACCGLTLCEQRCPNGSLKMGDADAVLERPRLRPSLEAEGAPGLYLCGDVTGTPLIKNAIAQGARAAEAAHHALAGRPRDPQAVDVCIVGAGPAGISAALRFQELGAKMVVLEQGGVAQSIQSFPRGKLVFDQPLELPVLGKLWLKESTKEELLLHWMRVVRREGLAIEEDTRMTGIDRRADGLFIVNALTKDGATRTVLARTVLLAIGQRGTPRRLPVPVPPEAEGRVYYHLADARSLAGQRVVIVGLGDSAMETAVALATQPRTSVTILHRGATYSRGQPRNIAEVERLRKAGRLHVRFGVEIAEVGSGFVVVDGAEGRARLTFEALFVLIGHIPPWDTLRRAGIRSNKEELVG
jgi:thioredoxin reductase/NAD-dependent dihydropyrimidine dehydrogenase PreA subunit